MGEAESWQRPPYYPSAVRLAETLGDPPGRHRALVWGARHEGEALDSEQGPRAPEASAQSRGRLEVPEAQPGTASAEDEGESRTGPLPDAGRARAATSRGKPSVTSLHLRGPPAVPSPYSPGSAAFGLPPPTTPV